MADVSKHDAEEERIGNHIESCRVYFFVGWDAIGLHYFMEGIHKLVDLKEGGRSQFVLGDLLNLSNASPRACSQFLLHFTGELGRHPK